MSVREEDRQKTSCPSRGLGLAAAAIGVGVGAALYYFFNKRPENPDSEGATSSSWTCEEPQALHRGDENEQVRNLRDEHFRQRSWSLEECSICCEVMLKDQALEELPCAHSFHAACVRPWLSEHRTCPNCRKLA